MKDPDDHRRCIGAHVLSKEAAIRRNTYVFVVPAENQVVALVLVQWNLEHHVRENGVAVDPLQAKSDVKDVPATAQSMQPERVRKWKAD